MSMAGKIRVTVWNEYVHEKTQPTVAEIYPKGIHAAISDMFSGYEEFDVRMATLDQPEQGLSNEVLEWTDVLIWWGHIAHEMVRDDIVESIHQRILNGMGFVVLHSGMQSKIFKRLMGTTCNLKWREIGEKERIWVIDYSHPIVSGLNEYFEIPHTEMYGEHFDIPAPDNLVFISWYAGGEVFRSGGCYYRGAGRIFYFSPGHEDLPIYYQKEVIIVIRNAARWAAPVNGPVTCYGNVKPLEDV